MNLYFIGGASGSGKTAVIPYLKEIFSDVAIYDFDDIGVPENADKVWRQESTEKWLQKLLAQGEDAILLGQMVLGEILACPSAKKLAKVNFCLLDVNDSERVKRINRRGGFVADQHMLNWSSWLRMHHQDPSWARHVIMDSSAKILDFSNFEKLTTYQHVANTHILDTTDKALNQVALNIQEWMNTIKNLSESIVIANKEYQLQLNATGAYFEIDQKLFEFNKSCVPPTQIPDVIPLNFTIKDQNEIVAGICGDVYIWNILYISVFFVEKTYRQQGFGSFLLNKLEEKAQKLGVELIHLDTFDFQAKDFYLQHGYEIFGVLEDCPKGHQRFYMKKVLNQESKKLERILDTLKAREPIFHHPEIFGKTKKDIENQMCDEFWEVGASGNIYTREDVIDTLVERYQDKNYQDIWETSDFKLTQICKDAYLITYHLIQNDNRYTRRSTIWVNKGGLWKILYHQGTIINEY